MTNPLPTSTMFSDSEIYFALNFPNDLINLKINKVRLLQLVTENVTFLENMWKVDCKNLNILLQSI